MALLTFEQIREKCHANIKTEDVFVPSLGGDIRIAKLGAEQKISLGMRSQTYERVKDEDGKTHFANHDDLAEFNVVLLCMCIVDERGEHPFNTPAGRQLINNIDSNDIIMLAKRAITLNGMDREDALEDAKKNLSDQDTNSPSLSALPLDLPVSTPITCSTT